MQLHPSSEFIEVCLGSTVEVICTTSTSVLFWRTSPDCFACFTKANNVGLVLTFCDFETILLSTSPSLVSKATLGNVSSAHSGTVLTCVNTIQLNPGADQMANIIIFIKGTRDAHHNVIVYCVHVNYCNV